MKAFRAFLIGVTLLGIQVWALYNVHTDKAVPVVEFDFNWLNME